MVSIFAAALALGGSAQADDRISPPPPPPPPIDDGGGGGGGTTGDKEGSVAAVELMFDLEPGVDLYLTPEQEAAGMWVRRGYLHDDERMLILGSYIRAWFNDEYSYSIPWNRSAVIRKGRSHSVWYGLQPYNADRIAHTDHFWVSGLEVSVATGGISAQVEGNNVYVRLMRTNDWQIHHHYQGLRWEGFGLFNIGHQLTSQFDFYEPNTSATLWPRDSDLI